MLDNLKNVFNQDAITSLQTKSTSIVDVFTKTVSDLKAVNEQATAEEKERLEEKAKIDEELAKLGAIKADNQKVIEKIGKIFE